MGIACEVTQKTINCHHKLAHASLVMRGNHFVEEWWVTDDDDDDNYWLRTLLFAPSFVQHLRALQKMCQRWYPIGKDTVI